MSHNPPAAIAPHLLQQKRGSNGRRGVQLLKK